MSCCYGRQSKVLACRGKVGESKGAEELRNEARRGTLCVINGQEKGTGASRALTAAFRVRGSLLPDALHVSHLWRKPQHAARSGRSCGRRRANDASTSSHTKRARCRGSARFNHGTSKHPGTTLTACLQSVLPLSFTLSISNCSHSHPSIDPVCSHVIPQNVFYLNSYEP